MVAIHETGVGQVAAQRALPWTMIGPPSVSFRAATSSSDRRIVAGQPGSSSARVVDTTYLGIAL